MLHRRSTNTNGVVAYARDGVGVNADDRRPPRLDADGARAPGAQPPRLRLGSDAVNGLAGLARLYASRNIISDRSRHAHLACFGDRVHTPSRLDLRRNGW